MSDNAVPQRSLWRRRLRAFLEDSRGVAAAEAALIAAPAMLVASFLAESGAMWAVSVRLEAAAADAASRLSADGGIASSSELAKLKSDICSGLPAGLDCAKNLDVETGAKRMIFTADAAHFETAAAPRLNIVRIAYAWRIITPLVSIPFSNAADGRRLLVGAAAYKPQD